MSLSTILKYNKPETIEKNNVLLEIARKVVNSSPEPRYKIKLRDEVLAMKEKERLGFNFNRSVTASLKSRWDVVEKATVDYLQEIMDMNEQIEEDNRKYETQLINLIVTRTTNLSLDSRIEQMAGLFMHMNFYCTVLRYKIMHLEPTKQFMFTCSDLMGFSRPSQLIDRYAALQHVFSELYADYDARQNLLNQLTETLSDVKAETSHRNMLLHNQMAILHEQVKHIQNECAQLDRVIQDQMEMSSGTSLEIYKIRNSVYNIYVTMMNYRGLEATETDSFLQLEELDVRISHTQAAVRELQEEEAKRQIRKNLRRKHEKHDSLHSFDEETWSEKSDVESEMEAKTRSSGVTENRNVSARESLSLEVNNLLLPGGRSSTRHSSNACEPLDSRRNRPRAGGFVVLPPINLKGTLITASQGDADHQKFAEKLRLLDTNSNTVFGRTAGKIWGKINNPESRIAPAGEKHLLVSKARPLTRSSTTEMVGKAFRKGIQGSTSGEGVLPGGAGFLKSRADSWAPETGTNKETKDRASLGLVSEFSRKGSDGLQLARPGFENTKEPEKESLSSSDDEPGVIEMASGDLKPATDEEELQSVKTADAKVPGWKEMTASSGRVAGPADRDRVCRTDSTEESRARTLSEIIGRRNLREKCLSILSEVKLHPEPSE